MRLIWCIFICYYNSYIAHHAVESCMYNGKIYSNLFVTLINTTVYPYLLLVSYYTYSTHIYTYMCISHIIIRTTTHLFSPSISRSKDASPHQHTLSSPLLTCYYIPHIPAYHMWYLLTYLHTYRSSIILTYRFICMYIYILINIQIWFWIQSLHNIYSKYIYTHICTYPS